MMFIIILLATTAAALTSIDVYGRDLFSHFELPLGTITYNEEDQAVAFNAKDLWLGSDSLCLGTRDLPDHDCFVYHELAGGQLTGKFQLFTNDAGVYRLSFSPSLHELTVEVIEVQNGPGPNLNPVMKDTRPATQAKPTPVLRKRVVKGDDGSETIVEEEVLEVVEEDNRSWVQKNWMYIVPPLVLFLVLLPGDSPESK